MTQEEMHNIINSNGFAGYAPEFTLQLSDKVSPHLLHIYAYSPTSGFYVYNHVKMLKTHKQEIIDLAQQIEEEATRVHQEFEYHSLLIMNVKHTQSKTLNELVTKYSSFKQICYVTPKDFNDSLVKTQQLLAQLRLDINIQEKLKLVENL